MAVKIRIIGLGLVVIVLAGLGLEKIAKELDQYLKTTETIDYPEEKVEEFRVKRVIDGDTIEMENGSIIRYIGVDSPETKEGEMAEKALLTNKGLVEGRVIDLEKDVSESDRYGRLLRYVFVEGEMVNLIMVEKGMAQVATFPPDVKYKDKFLQAQIKAKEDKVGLWAEK